MIGFTDGTGYDWSGIALQAARLTKERDELLNQKNLKQALKVHYQLEDVELELSKWIIRKIT